jgi:hypothetical protein
MSEGGHFVVSLFPHYLLLAGFGGDFHQNGICNLKGPFVKDQDVCWVKGFKRKFQMLLAFVLIRWSGMKQGPKFNLETRL